MSDIMINDTNIEAFRKAYQACEGDTFTFKGQEMDKGYAMYFLQNWDENINTPRGFPIWGPYKKS